MADSLNDLLAPYLAGPATAGPHSHTSSTRTRYLTRLTTLSLDALHSTEPQSLAQSAHSVTLSLQALANRSNKPIITASDSLATLHTSLPALTDASARLRDAIPQLDEQAVRFASTYSKSGQNVILDRRKQAMLLARNVDRLSDILELPSLLSTAISSSSMTHSAPNSTFGANYSSALDLFAHIKRLQILYPSSAIVKTVLIQAEDAMKEMTSNLISSLRSQQNIRLAAAIRTISWLRRVAPDLSLTDGEQSRKTITSPTQDEGSFGALFLVCRLANLVAMLEALAPLRDLADQETERRVQAREEGLSSEAKVKNINSTVSRTRSDLYLSGQQSERYLKRYLEIFREQAFASISMYKNIFPEEPTDQESTHGLGLLPLPPSLQTFPLHLVDLLTDTLKAYLPNILDSGARESLLTQVLYTAGSLGRLGADFGLIISLLDEDENEEEPNEVDSADTVPEWQDVMKKHRIQAGRLEALATGHGLS